MSSFGAYTTRIHNKQQYMANNNEWYLSFWLSITHRYIYIYLFDISVSYVIELATCWWKWSIWTGFCDKHTKCVCFKINRKHVHHEWIVQLTFIGKQTDRTNHPSIWINLLYISSIHFTMWTHSIHTTVLMNFAHIFTHQLNHTETPSNWQLDLSWLKFHFNQTMRINR